MRDTKTRNERRRDWPEQTISLSKGGDRWRYGIAAASASGQTENEIHERTGGKFVRAAEENYFVTHLKRERAIIWILLKARATISVSQK